MADYQGISPGSPGEISGGRKRNVPVERRPFRHPSLTGVMVLPLTRGLSALIDEDVHQQVGRWNWAACPQTFHEDAFYATAWIDGRKISLHRFLWTIWKRPPTPTIDHFDGNVFDYRRSNLRPATNAQNVTNNRKLRPGAAERYLSESRARISNRQQRRDDIAVAA